MRAWLRLVVILWLSLLSLIQISCSSTPPLPTPESVGCTSGQTTSSCFYREDPHHKNSKLIIFVHGVFGSASSTWGNPTSATYWPKMLTNDARFAEGYDIYFINYRTPFVGQAPNIHETAGNELGKLESHGVFSRYQEIHFITHSMGGLVTKSMLTRLNRGEVVKKLRKVISVVYLATPAQGARIAELATWVSLNPQLNDMARAHLNTYIQSLEDDWVHLVEDRDKAKGEFPRAYCAYETLKAEKFNIPSVLVVPRELATSRCDGPLHPMPFDHLSIAEPTRMDDDPYLWTMAKIVEAGSTGVAKRKAVGLVDEADRLALAGENTNARKAYDEARTIYKTLNDAQGKANVLRGLGDLERILGRNDQARAAYTEARSLYQAVGDRLGEANVLLGLGQLEAQTNPNLARQHFYQAALLYEQLEMHDWKARALKSADEISSEKN